MKEKLGEGYHPMGKKASYNDAVPNVKIVLKQLFPHALIQIL